MGDVENSIRMLGLLDVLVYALVVTLKEVSIGALAAALSSWGCEQEGAGVLSRPFRVFWCYATESIVMCAETTGRSGALRGGVPRPPAVLWCGPFK